MKRKWLDRKPDGKTFKPRTSKLSTSRKSRRDPGQRQVPSTDECTRMFNEAVRLYWQANDVYLCAKCGEGPKYMDPLEVSHFFNVRYSGTRFDPENVCPLHRHCHTGDRKESWEYQKHEGGEYRKWMEQQLGLELFVILEVRSRWQISLEQARVEFIEKLREGTLWRLRSSE